MGVWFPSVILLKHQRYGGMVFRAACGTQVGTLAAEPNPGGHPWL